MSQSRKKLSDEVRRAIWEAWNKKSAYTGEPLLWTQLHIDHVIPISRSDIVNRFRDKGYLPSDFDINGFENLLPSLNHENQGKSAREMSESALIYFLEKASEKKPIIERRIARDIDSTRQMKLFLDLKTLADRNDVSPEEIVRFFDHQFEGAVTLRITPKIEGARISSANAVVAAALMDKPFALGGGAVQAVNLYSDSGKFVRCQTSNEFIKAQEDGYYPLTQADIKIASMAHETTEALRAIRDSSFALESVLREPVVTLRHLNRWAAEWVTDGLAEQEDKARAEGLRTIADLLDAGICVIDEMKDHEASFFVRDGLDVVMRESLRADLDGDQWEEILIFHYLSAARNGGSFGGGQAIMAKAAEDGLIYMRDYPPAKTS